MNISWKDLAKIGNGILTALVPGVAQVEAIAVALKKSGKTMTGPEKKAAVLELVAAAVPVVEGISQKDLLDDAKVLAAASSIIDGTVAFHQAVAEVIAAKKGGTAGGATPTP